MDKRTEFWVDCRFCLPIRVEYIIACRPVISNSFQSCVSMCVCVTTNSTHHNISPFKGHTILPTIYHNFTWIRIMCLTFPMSTLTDIMLHQSIINDVHFTVYILKQTIAQYYTSTCGSFIYIVLHCQTKVTYSNDISNMLGLLIIAYSQH